jgi:hypothetical protein
LPEQKKWEKEKIRQGILIGKRLVWWSWLGSHMALFSFIAIQMTAG